MNKLEELLYDFELVKDNYKGYLTNKVLDNHLNMIAREIVVHLISVLRMHPFAYAYLRKDFRVKKEDFNELCEMLNNMYAQQITSMTGRAPMFSKEKAENLKAGYADGVTNMGRHLLAKLNIKLEE